MQHTLKTTFIALQMPDYPNLTAAIAFMVQVKDVGNWKPLNLKYAAMVHFTKMLEVPQVCV